MGWHDDGSMVVSQKPIMNTYKFIFRILPIYVGLLFLFTQSYSQDSYVKVGADVFIEKYIHTMENKSVGVICNHTSVLRNGKHLVDVLIESGVNIKALFSPEHGIRGEIPAGIKIENQKDKKTGIPIYSLYGNSLKPTFEMLKDIEILIFDLQDAGARFYTYSVTMGYAMQAAAEMKIKFTVLDRPNPVNGNDIEGPILKENLFSNIGIFPIPIRHGLTLGELSLMIVGEKWLNGLSDLNLVVVPMVDWKRELYYDETGVSWIPPSPNMKFVTTAIVYPGTCLFEGTNISEGRGTSRPFEYIGAPWINGKKLAERLNKRNLTGIEFQPIYFTPKGENLTRTNKYQEKMCEGIFINVTDRKYFSPFTTAYDILYEIFNLYPDSAKFYPNYFDKLAGTENVRKSIISNDSNIFNMIISQDSLLNYREKRKKHLIY